MSEEIKVLVFWKKDEAGIFQICDRADATHFSYENEESITNPDYEYSGQIWPIE